MKKHDFEVNGKIEENGQFNWPDILYLTIPRNKALQIIEQLASGLRSREGNINLNLVGKFKDTAPF